MHPEDCTCTQCNYYREWMKAKTQAEVATGIAEINRRTYERCAIINRSLRDALGYVMGWQTEIDENGWHKIVIKSDQYSACNRALNLTPSKADEIREARDNVCEEASRMRAAGLPDMGHMNALLDTLDAKLKEHTSNG